MIRINLLPFRTARKKEFARRRVSIILLSFLLTLAALTLFNLHLGSRIDTLTSKIDATRKQVEKYRQDAKEVDRIKKKLATLRKKTEVINNLENNRQWPVRLLDSMTQVVVPKRMWFTRLGVKNNGVGINGIALDNKTVADFMVRLEKTGLYSSVELKKIARRQINNSNLKQFQIHCRLITPAQKKAAEKGKGAPAKKK